MCKLVVLLIQSFGINGLQLDKIELQPALYLCKLLIPLDCTRSFQYWYKFVTLLSVGLFKSLIINKKHPKQGVQSFRIKDLQHKKAKK